jgi:catechol 2,3-dioxygenase-like lactoylglutathione lyase family enzyme
MNMNNPIQNKISSVFLHVRSVERSANWYHRLFGFPERKSTYDAIHSLRMSEDSPGLILDQLTTKFNRSERPLFMFHSNDVRADYRYVKSLGIEVVWNIEDHGDMAFFTFRDPDGNLLMVCGEPGENLTDDRLEESREPLPSVLAGDSWKAWSATVTATVRQSMDGILLQGRIESSQPCRTPLRIEAEVKVSQAEIQLFIGQGTVTFSGGIDGNELIVQHPAANKQVIFKNKGALPRGKWVRLTVEINELDMKLYVEGQLRHAQQGDYRHVFGPAGIVSIGGDAEIRLLQVQQGEPVYEPTQLGVTTDGQRSGSLVPIPGTFARMTKDGLWMTDNERPSNAWTTHEFKPPFECKAVVRSDLGDIIFCIGITKIRIVEGTVRFLDRTMRETVYDAAFPIPCDEELAVKWVIEPGRAAVYVNDRLLAEDEGQYPQRKVCTAIGTDIGSVIAIKSVDIREMK